MAVGTGLPGAGQGRKQIVRPGEIVRAEGGTAALWGELARTGAELAQVGTDVVKGEMALQAIQQKQQAARFIADAELSARQKQVELREQHRYDPEGFSKAWQEHTNGVLGSTEPSLVPELRVMLGQEGLRAQNELTRERASRDEGLAKQSHLARLDMSEQDLLTVAASGGTGEEIVQARLDYENVLNSAVSFGFMARDEADRRMMGVNSRAVAESVTVNVRSVYDAKGAEAATQLVRQQLLEKQPDGVTVADARGAAARAMAEIRQMESSRKAALSEAKVTATELKGLMRQGVLVPPAEVEQAAAALRGAGGGTEAAELLDMHGQVRVLNDLARLPPLEQEQALVVLERQAEAGQVDPFLLREMRELPGRTRTALNQDPMGHAARIGVVQLKPIDWTGDAAAFEATMVERRQSAGVVEQQYGLATIPPLTRDEIAGLKNAYDRADAAGRTVILGRLAKGLDGDRLTSTLKEVAGERPVFAWAGGLFKTNPDVALSVVRGEAVMAADKKTVPSVDQAFQSAVTDYLGEAMAVTPQARAAAVQAAMARYADLSATAGDLSGTLDEDRLEQALSDVTGGVGRWNGRKVVLPPGVDEERFETLLDGLSDADLAGAVTAKGTAVKASDFRKLGTLVDYGNGRYLVDLGGAGYVQRVGGGPFVLDLGAKASQQDPASAPRRQSGGVPDAYVTGGVAASYGGRPR